MAIDTCKISLSDTLNQIFIKGKFLGYHKLDTLEHFCQTKYDETGCLLLTAVNKEGKDKVECRASYSQLKHLVNERKISVLVI